MGRSLGAVHVERVLGVLAGGGIANSGLAASWRRSGHVHSLDPTNRAPSRRLTHGEVVAAQERLGRLLKVAQSTLDRLFLAVTRGFYSRPKQSGPSTRYWRSIATIS